MRIPRRPTIGAVHHVISRFVDRSWLLTDDQERGEYLRLLGRALDRSSWRCLAYALMSNHIHLAFVAGEDAMSTWTKRTHSPFANWINERHGRLGPVFADRPAMFVVRPEHEGRLIAYIHNNPVRAGVAPSPGASPWTSHAAYLRARAPSWLHVEEGLARCGVDRAGFDAWVTSINAEAPQPELGSLQRAVRARGAVHVATPTVAPTEAPLVRRPFARLRPDPRTVVDVVAAVVGAPATAFASRRRHPQLVAARVITAQAGRALGLTGSEIAAALGVERQTVSRLACRRISSAERALTDAVISRLA
jgi:putative transposase